MNKLKVRKTVTIGENQINSWNGLSKQITRKQTKVKKKREEINISRKGSQMIQSQIFGEVDQDEFEKHKVDIKEILKKNAKEMYGKYDDPNVFKDYEPLPHDHLLDKMNFLFSPYNKMHDLSQGNLG